MELVHVLVIAAIVIILFAAPVTAIVLLVTFMIRRDRNKGDKQSAGTEHSA